ncbi:MAG: putative selenate reductase subunit YgfK [Treponema sp.]
MSDRMNPIPFKNLMEWIKNEYQAEGSIFGVKKIYRADPAQYLELFGQRFENPLGPAAGPHTQLAQNIVAAYAAGCRFFELKTVQKIDGEDLPVAKPCINAADECYNVEWSTELRVPEAFDEYVKAWFALKVISQEYGLGSPDGFIFNMSVGYDLEGIKTPKVDSFIEGMKNASATPVWKECTEYLRSHKDRFPSVSDSFLESLPVQVCTSITLSTLHGCPPAEIERIAMYLITEKNLHTYIKCNPTLLGYEFARKRMNEMGYEYIQFDDHHFKSDLQFSDAVPMLRRLQEESDKRGLMFGVKITNTFPVDIARGELPGQEMYMSGRSLFPLSIAVALKLSEAFNGKLRISYSGGADYFNIADIFETGICPITIATTILKPGGYARCGQLADLLTAKPFTGDFSINLEKLRCLSDNVVRNPRHCKSVKPEAFRKIPAPVPLVDCFEAPCISGCPIHQDIPAYIRLTGEKKYDEALRVITDKNPLPFITGTICNHRCMSGCTRSFYEDHVHIRAVKLEAAEHAIDGVTTALKARKPVPKNGVKAAVIGAGPAGLAAAYFLTRDGAEVTVFEKKAQAGGIVQYVIPEFRISHGAIQHDIDLAASFGASFVYNSEQTSVEELKKQGFTHVIFAIGAWKQSALRLEKGEAANVIEFLEKAKQAPDSLKLGKNVIILGAGNTAMDAARVAKRTKGVEHSYIVYRRTKQFMPADAEELELALEDGVEFLELLAPVSYENGILRCEKMRLGERGADGRQKPEPSGEFIDLAADTVIASIGEKIDTGLFEANGIELDGKGRARYNPASFETNVKGVYVIGDCAAGPATVVEAIADASKAARAITESVQAQASAPQFKALNYNPDTAKPYSKRAILMPLNLAAGGVAKESVRCLECSTVCESCADVCPNRANLAITVPGMRMKQIIHVDGMCNECGNCATFCPYESAPYKDKFTIFHSETDFLDSENQGFFFLDAERTQCRVRLCGGTHDVSLAAGGSIPKELLQVIQAVKTHYGYLL